MTNTEVVQRALEAFGRGDVAAVLECLAEDADFDEPKPAEGSLRKHTTSAQVRSYAVPGVPSINTQRAVARRSTGCRGCSPPVASRPSGST